MTAEICAHGTLLGYCLECSGIETLRAEVRALRAEIAEARRECDQWAIRFDSALKERDEARAKVAQFHRTFDGHVYVSNEDYSKLCRERDEETARAEMYRRDWYAVEVERDTARAQLAERDARIAELEGALKAILIEPYGCPMCDSGVLRKSAVKSGKDHWDTCGYPKARAALTPPTENET